MFLIVIITAIHDPVQISLTNNHLHYFENGLSTFVRRTGHQTSEMNNAIAFAEKQGNELSLYDNMGY